MKVYAIGKHQFYLHCCKINYRSVFSDGGIQSYRFPTAQLLFTSTMIISCGSS